MKKVAIILINYKDYASRFLSDCVESVRVQDYDGEIKVFITDNETSLETQEYLARMAPEAELILNKGNDGFAKGNNDAMKIAMDQGFEYIMCLNLDTIIERDAVRKIVEVFELNRKPSYSAGRSAIENRKSQIGAVQARLMMHPDKNVINSLGNYTHFLGFGGCDGYQEKIENRKSKIENFNIAYPSGAAVMFKTEILKEVGLFDEEMWMYNEDQDLGWRIWLTGYRCVLAKDAVVYHKYEFSRSVKKMFWMDRNRIIAIIKNYHILTLILIIPAFIVMELGLTLFSLKSGWWHEKKSVWRYFLKKKTWDYLIRERRRVQGLRKVKDSDIISLFPGVIWYQEVDDWKLRLINPVFDFYWKIVKIIVIW